MDPNRWVGRPIRRTKDESLLTGRGRFLDDIRLKGQVYAHFLRSPFAHAKIGRLETEEAVQTTGVLGVYTASDFPMEPLPPFLWDSISAAVLEAVRPHVRSSHPPLLASDRAVYSGQAFAVLLAESPQVAEDAAGSISVDFEPLPNVANTTDALVNPSTFVNEAWGDNVAVRLRIEKGDAERAIRTADLVVRETMTIQRQAGVPLEPRGAIGMFDIATGRLTLWSSTQNVHPLKRAFRRMSGLTEDEIRVIAPEVGGGFGTKGVLYPEEIVVGLLAMKLDRPVKWVEGRLEHMHSAIHARDQVHRIELALSDDGIIQGLKDDITVDCGAYNPLGIVVPYNTAAHLVGPYRIENLLVEAVSAVTNKVPNAPYRGAGRPEATFALERVIEIGARRLGIDPVEIRMRNLIQAEAMPYEAGLLYRDGHPIVLDSGNYPATLALAKAEIDASSPSRNRDDARDRGLAVGTGFACYIEGTGIGPFEGAAIKIDPDGRLEIRTGASSQGQGHETILTQICADKLDIDIGSIEVVAGDTDAIERGWGTVASRIAVTAGNAVAEAADSLLALCLKNGASELGIDAANLEMVDGQVRNVFDPKLSINLGALAEASKRMGEPLEATAYYEPPTVTWSNGVHAVSVGLDLETGDIEILDYVVVHDCGVVINPLIVEGQIHGAVAQGIGGALYEELEYDDNGQILNGTLAGYVIPASMEIPLITTAHLSSPSPLNELGIKGMGEGGAVAPPAAIANAVETAISDPSVVIRRTPLRPSYVMELIARTTA